MIYIEGLKPQIESLILDASKEQIDVVWFDFKEALYSILSDKTLMKPDNLLSEVDVKKQYVDDINSGSIWQKANKIYIEEPYMDRLIPIIFFIDKTHTDFQGRLKLEPITFTIGIFKRKIRNSITRAWRTLGFPTDIMSKKNVKKEIKLQDYHNILKVILPS